MSECTRNGGGRPITQLRHDRGRFGVSVQTSLLGVHHDLVAGGELVNAMTGYGQEEDKRRSIEAGFNYHLVKPANFKQVKEILANVS